ncbi:hypothetical protein J437_LFUL000534 [Ladona fulva]|uniref:Uncharacterized protein n=1 Tax=Ladona fulva TaxID=123851 RepID=A0A8K0JTR5_LADFU|nr:hypothetical protein J437_LFUL000534 [Ladona fulva]
MVNQNRVAAFEVELRAPSFVIRGGSALLRCDHEVDTALLHKVEWLKDGDTKLFQFVRGRNPPFRNFTTPGATLDLFFPLLLYWKKTSSSTSSI